MKLVQTDKNDKKKKKLGILIELNPLLCHGEEEMSKNHFSRLILVRIYRFAPDLYENWQKY